MACRATWRVCKEDMEHAAFQIASKRMHLDDAISAIKGVHFFFSCVTSVASNLKSKRDEGGQNSQQTYPSIAYFIAYTPCEETNDNTFFTALHNRDFEPDIQQIKVRSSANNEMENAARQLFQTVKDHNNPTIREMLDVSNVYCYRHAGNSSTDDESDEEFYPTHFPSVPCCFTIVNHDGYMESFHSAIKRLESDGLVFETTFSPDVDTVQPISQRNEITTTIRKIARLMHICHHALYRSAIYTTPDNAKTTYVRMMDVSSYLNKLLANEALNNDLLRHFQAVEKILSHPACEMITQIEFDLDLIEVSNGCCFSISQRKFIPNPIPSSKIGKLSPRAFVPYDCSTPPQPRYFKQGILNSFPDEAERVNFLNKFYQCLLAKKMPQKTKKLVVAGPRDSGKTSWANVFHRIVPPECIASVTNEGQFSAAMMTQTTQLVIIDEWSRSRMQSDLAKILLQGGWMVTSVKHGVPRQVNNNSPFYITTNHVPDFGNEDENVKRRIAIFNTTSLPEAISGIDRWIYDNAMHCIAWVAEEIQRHQNLISEDEIWLENASNLVVPPAEGESLWKRHEIDVITDADLQPHCPEETSTTDESSIHAGFAAEFESRRLARKRLKRSFMVDSDEDELVINSPNTPPPDHPEMQAVHSGDTADQPSTSFATNDASNAIELGSNKETREEENFVASGVERTKGSDLDEWETTGEHHFDDGPSTSAALEKDDQTLDTPRDGWQLNSDKYFRKVAHYIKSSLNRDMTKKGHVYSFQERLRKAELRRTHEEKQFWVLADPFVDAWLLMLARKRDVFDIKKFAQKHPETTDDLNILRRTANVRVMPDRCPLSLAIEALGATDEDTNEGNSPRARPRPGTQSYWTKIKSWRPW